MDPAQIDDVINRVAKSIGHNYNPFDLRDDIFLEGSDRHHDVLLLINDIIETGSKIKMLMLQQYNSPQKLDTILDDLDFPIIVFENRDGFFFPVILEKRNNRRYAVHYHNGRFEETEYEFEQLSSFVTRSELGDKFNNQIIFLTPASLQPLVSINSDSKTGEEESEMTPSRRLFRLLGTEKKDIGYVYIYAVIIGVFSLSLPIGVQAIINFVSGGLIFNSVVLLITLVILGVLVSGALQIMQMAMVEVLQRRIFAKAAFEFAYRIPKVKVESLFKSYAPELMNRFFDILTVQKGLPKLLIDMTQAVLQILFGLILLSFYHPFFVFFGILLFTTLFLILYYTGPKGLKTSIYESKYKYKIAHWLEELARTMIPFKLAGFTNLPLQKMDQYLNNYLKSRKAHFKVLINQFAYIILFKTAIVGGVLIMGSLLVIDKQITLGQFVATEIVILMIINAVEKIIVNMDIIYDMLTAVDKIGHVTDLPLERDSGIIMPRSKEESGLHVKIKNLNYKYPSGKQSIALRNISFEVKSGQKLAIAGYNESGKFTLVQIIAGILHNYEGIITLDGLSLRDIDLNSLRDNVGKYVFKDDIFEGTIYDNISMGISRTNVLDVMWAIENVGLSDTINALPDGLNTEMVAGGKGFSTNIIKRIILARAIAERPRLLLLNDFLGTMSKPEKRKLINFLFSPDNHWSLVCITNDPMVLAQCDNIIVLKNGELVAEGDFNSLATKNELRDILSVSNE